MIEINNDLTIIFGISEKVKFKNIKEKYTKIISRIAFIVLNEKG